MNQAKLFVVGTPIGNLGDWSPRAQEVLSTVGAIACEDTRRTGGLLSKHNIANPGLIVMNEHTEREAAKRIVSKLHGGEHAAIVSDAGMPVIRRRSKPASRSSSCPDRLRSRLPLPSLASAAGDSCSRASFPARVVTVPTSWPTWWGSGASSCCMKRRIAWRARWPMHEEVWRGTLAEAAAGNAEPRGEYVIVIDAAAPAPEATDETLLADLQAAIATGMSKKDAIAAVVAATRAPRNRVYDLAMSL